MEAIYLQIAHSLSIFNSGLYTYMILDMSASFIEVSHEERKDYPDSVLQLQ